MTSPLHRADPKRDASLSPADNPAVKKPRGFPLTPHETTGRSGASDGRVGTWRSETIELVRDDNDPGLAEAFVQSLAQADVEKL